MAPVGCSGLMEYECDLSCKVTFYLIIVPLASVCVSTFLSVGST